MKKGFLTALSAVALMSVVGLSNTKEAQASTSKSWSWQTPVVTYKYTNNIDRTTKTAINEALYNFNKQNFVQYKYDPNGVVTFSQGRLEQNDWIGQTQTWTKNNHTLATKSEVMLTNAPDVYARYGREIWNRQYSTAMHEIGHVSGLDHNHDNWRSVMAERRQHYLNKLSYDDKLVLQNKYCGLAQPTFKKGIVTINYVPGYGINLYQGTGNSFTGRRLKHGTSWKFNNAVNVNGVQWYNVGGNQWVQGAYTTVK